MIYKGCLMLLWVVSMQAGEHAALAPNYLHTMLRKESAHTRLNAAVFKSADLELSFLRAGRMLLRILVGNLREQEQAGSHLFGELHLIAQERVGHEATMKRLDMHIDKLAQIHAQQKSILTAQINKTLCIEKTLRVGN